MEQEALRVKEFCHKYAISRTSFYREVWSDRLGTIKRGRTTLICKDEAERWFGQLAYAKSQQTMNKRYSAALKST